MNVCNDCGSRFWEDDNGRCPYCGSPDISPLNDPEEEEDDFLLDDDEEDDEREKDEGEDE